MIHAIKSIVAEVNCTKFVEININLLFIRCGLLEVDLVCSLYV